MKAILKLENIGQKIGTEIKEFNSGRVTEIRGRTASGKSRYLKSLALALSLPITSDEILNNAISFGIAKAENKKFSPLLNSNEKKATIELQYGEVSKIVDLKRDGTEQVNIPGNQNFLYCSMLVENSKIHHHIDQGISDFSWIVTEMSLAKDYETINEILNSYLDLLNKKKEEVERKIDEKKKAESRFKIKERELEEKLSEIAEVEKKIDNIKLNPQLKKERDNIIEQLKELNNRQRDDEKTLQDVQKQLSLLEKKIGNSNKIIDRNRNEIGELEEKKKTLQKININSLNEDIDKLRIQKEDSYKSIADLNKILGGKNSKRDDWENALKRLKKDGKKEELCWVCEKGTISEFEIIKNLKKIESEIIPLKEKIGENKRSIQARDDGILKKQSQKGEKRKIPEIKKSIDELWEITHKLQKQKNNLEDEQRSSQSDINQFIGPQNVLEERLKEIKQLEKELKTIDNKISEDEQAKKIIDEKDFLTKSLGGIENEIKNLKKLIDQENYIKFLDIDITILEASDILSNLEEIFLGVNDHLTANIKEQREGAAIKFNKNIQKVIEELKFTEFKEISLNLEDYNLNIMRKDNTNQPINSLSGGEKVVVSSVLQISAKETYNPDIPFIVGDDIILRMDDFRREIFINYLKNIAKENNWFIVLTRVTDEDLIIEEI